MDEAVQSNERFIARSFIVNRRSGRTLAIRRLDSRNNPFKYEVPGGKFVPEEEHMLTGLKREVYEETRLKIVPTSRTPLYVQSDIMRHGQHDGIPCSRRFFIATQFEGVVNVEESDEHYEYCWCTYPQFMKLDLTNETRDAAKQLMGHLRRAGVRGVPHLKELYS